VVESWAAVVGVVAAVRNRQKLHDRYQIPKVLCGKQLETLVRSNAKQTREKPNKQNLRQNDVHRLRDQHNTIPITFINALV
jgi:hypothetical protein